MEQTILVTGSTSGFGRLTVETLARQGYRVFAGMRAAAGKNAPAAEALRGLAQQERLALQIVEIDVTDDTDSYDGLPMFKAFIAIKLAHPSFW
jgi:NAD(P)-dependent dehydrogenase (short-subunit alcohol dehydrogenase family)